MLKVKKVKKNSIAHDLGIEAGDEIVAFEDFACEDELDYLYYETKSQFWMTVKDLREGKLHEVRVEKAEDEDIGLTFEKNTKIRTCHNNCVFCFVDQMPKGMRESLYVKDDDYSMSFTCGNFVTLTNLSDEGLDRIIRLNLSPLYISVHTLNKELRCALLRNRFAGKIVEQIDKLAKAGIEMHCQAVLVPNKNDGDELEYTARELFKYYPYARDLACVPTGLTKFRDGLCQIEDVDKEYSIKLLDRVDKLNKEFGVNFLLPADEYFIKAEREFKPKEFYGEFEQIENGIGLTRKFICEVEETLSSLPEKKLKKPRKTLVISGVSAEKVNQDLAKKVMQKVDGLTVEVLSVENEFFGKTVTCTGLLTGTDIANAVENYLKINAKPDKIVIPANTLKEFEDVFLCGMTLKQLKKRLACKIAINRDGGAGFVFALAEK
jgi:putative radical SAM enzyme (TIGR03279 family)